MNNSSQEKNSVDYLSDDIRKTALYKIRPIILHGYVLPFIVFYFCWAYVWMLVLGVSDYFEAGMIGFAIIGLLQTLCCLFCYWFVEVRCLLTCCLVEDISEATHVQVVPAPNNGYSELVTLQKQQETNELMYWFEFQKTVFIYDSKEKKRFAEVTYPTDWSMQRYMDWKGYQEDEEVKRAEKHYGHNNLQMDIPKFIDLFKERATAPFFVFQVFCVGLWCLDEYWYYSIFTLVMLIVFEATLVQQQLKNMTEIRKMGNKPYMIQVFRNRKWRPVMSDMLVPGDIVSIVRSQEDRLVPCDMLLLRGPCIVDESMLTGESVPVMKEPAENLDQSEVFNFESHGKLHVLYGGTKVVQHTPPNKSSSGIKATDNGCVAFVLRHGFSTSQGKLLKTILFGVKQVTANNMETFMFILFLLFFAITAASYVWIVGSRNPSRNKYKLFLECTLILTSVVPPELPIELSLAVNTSLLALSKLYVYCTEPFRIPFAGKVDVCCFDKTGTLTSDDFVVQGIAGVKESGDGEERLCSASEAPLATTQVLATCHSLAQLDDSLVGDPLEKATLNAIQWNLTKGDAVVPRKSSRNMHGLKIYHRFHFSSALKRMSVIAGHTPTGDVNVEYIATVKGAPEVVKSMLVDVPDDFDATYLNFARQGARVLALAHKHMGNMSHQMVRDLTRDEVERGLNFVGFLIISCPLKSDSKAVVKEILHASHHVVMITGDNPLTACHVASELRMTKKQQPVLILTHQPDEQEWKWLSIDESLSIPIIQKDRKSEKNFIASYNLCLTGEGLDYLVKNHTGLFDRLLPAVRIHARVAPKQKEFIITSLKKLGFVTLMCGDGTNDVGALRHADVGVALLANAPERIPDFKKKKEEVPSGSSGGPKHPTSLMVGLTARTGKLASSSSGHHHRGSGGGLKDRTKAGARSSTSPAAAAAASNDAHAEESNNNPHLSASQKKVADLLRKIEEEEKAQVVRLGDASIASPFTSKLSTTLCVCHIIKQGRCTLVTTLQMFKILALNALILAYSQSVLYLDGVKFSDTQATMQGLLLAGCFLFISRSKPLNVLSKERPLPNIFNLYTIATVLCQFAIHFSCLVFLKGESESRMEPRTEEFPNLEEDFKPNLINTVIYIISISMQITTFAVNHKGHPFMAGLHENKPLLYSLLISAAVVCSLAAGILPELATHVELITLEAEFRNLILLVLFGNFLGSFIVDRILQFILCRNTSRPSIS
ncbi:hypothetical protein HELRODRAFT_113120 [Helobdella robusta]|uniref:Cation-transporting ATPase n=1 Tax=Helobdella robusta TaxID=6412 RepID=T1EFQ3_HELRO|nr:hypothetical protein HELRODRAFT_113120 [Helobdella robusta]ESO00564.1 hypothetical protein HELRODRAFT_113120 [Helobdella robusta]